MPESPLAEETLWPAVMDLLPNEDVVKAAQAFAASCIDHGEITSGGELVDIEKLLIETSVVKRGLERDKLDARRKVDAQKAAMSAGWDRGLDPILGAIKALEEKRDTWRRAEAARLQAEQTKANEDAAKERRRLEGLSKRAENRGDEERAIQLQERAAQVQAAPVATPAAVKTGVYERLTWHWEVVALHLLPDHLILMVPDKEALDALVASQKGNLRLPGLRVYSTPTTVAKGG